MPVKCRKSGAKRCIPDCTHRDPHEWRELSL